MIIADDIGLRGRMGNVLFKYAAMKSLAKYHNTEAKLSPNIDLCIEHGQYCCLKYFKYICSTYNPDDLQQIKNQYIELPWLTYYADFYKIPNNTNIIGYFQSEKYFEHIKDSIKQEFELIDSIQNVVDDKMKTIRMKYKDHTVIGIHMRRGDDNELNHRVYAPDVLTNDTWLYRFLTLAFNQFNDIENKVYIIFTGGSRDNNNSKDTEWCDINLQQFDIDFHVCKDNDYIIDFGMLKSCDHIILNSISTFGWWAGYLNKNPGKKIIVPKYIPDPQVNQIYDMNTYWSEEFITI